MGQQALANRAELSRSYISRLEHGLVANPKINDLEAVAQALSWSLAEMLTVEPDPEEAPQIVELQFSNDWEALQRETENLPPEMREIVLRAFKQSLEIANASDLARRN